MITLLRLIAFGRARPGRARSASRAVLLAIVVMGGSALSMTLGYAGVDGPEMVAAVTGDANADGFIDTIRVTFDTPMASTTPQKSVDGSPGFHVTCPNAGAKCPTGIAGYEIASFAWSSSTGLDITLVPGVFAEDAEDGASPDVAVPDTSAIPTVVYEEGPDGESGGAESAANDEEMARGSRQAADRAGPVLKAFKANDRGAASMFNAVGDEAFIVFSEETTIAGATSYERWSNLERAIRFTGVQGEFALDPNWSGCVKDSDGTRTDRTKASSSPTKYDPIAAYNNFPYPSDGSSTVDVILAPKAPAPGEPGEEPADYVTTFHVRHNEFANVGSTPFSEFGFSAVPKGCRVGIEPVGSVTQGSGTQPVLFDRAGNAARHQNEPADGAGRIRITPAEASLLSARTGDADTDGRIDRVVLKFDQVLDNATVEGNLDRISITVGGEEAEPTGATVSGDTMTVDFAPLDGAVWDTDTKPRIEYFMPADCSYDVSASTPGIKTRVPSSGAFPEYRACVGSFGVEATDGAKPVLLAAATADDDQDGALDRVEATFSEPVQGSSGAGWTIGSAAATAVVPGGAGSSQANVIFPESTTGDTADTPAVAYASQAANKTMDLAGNELVPVTKASTDGAAPRIRAATVRDDDGDGHVDRVDLSYSENLAGPATAAASRFQVGSVAASGFEAEAPGDNLLTLVFSGVQGSDAKEISFAPGSGSAIADAVGNVSGPQTFDAAVVQDAAKPRATITALPGAPLRAGVMTIVATFTERMATNAAPTVTLASTDASSSISKQATGIADTDHTNGWRNADPAVWEGTITIDPADCPVPTGCDVRVTESDATDASTAANPQAQAESLDTEVDTIAPLPPALGDARAVLPAGHTAPDNTVNMFTEDVSVAVSTSGDAGGGTARLLIDGAPVTPAATHGSMADGDDSVTVTTAYGSTALLQSALPAGNPHALTVELCDDAGNCTPSSNARDVTADYTPVGVQASIPAQPVVSGGSSMEITWESEDDDDFQRIELRYSTNGGTTYARSIVQSLTNRNGSFTWRVPDTLDSTQVRVRVATVDLAGNKAYAFSSESFTVDSSKPVVSVSAPSSRSPFLPAGGAVTVGWRATDLTLSRVSQPIRVQYSTDDGRSWRDVNGGSYSRANDGRETWRVPNVRSFTTRVRVLATDATGKVGWARSARLAVGVAGYTAEQTGRVYSFGTANSRTNESYVSRKGWVSDIAIRRDGKAGYLMSSKGNLYPFSIGSTRNSARKVKLSLREGTARAVALRTNTSGYVVDKYGEIHRFGGAPKARPSKTWSSSYARDIVLLPNGRGGYVLDKYGRLYPFKVGGYSMPPKVQSRAIFGSKRAVAAVLRSDGRSGYVLDKYGKVYSFDRRGVRRVSSRTGKYAKGIVLVTDTAGYWVDYRGILRPWGAAFGNPTRTRLGRARGAVGV